MKFTQVEQGKTDYEYITLLGQPKNEELVQELSMWSHVFDEFRTIELVRLNFSEEWVETNLTSLKDSFGQRVKFDVDVKGFYSDAGHRTMLVEGKLNDIMKDCFGSRRMVLNQFNVWIEPGVPTSIKAYCFWSFHCGRLVIPFSS